MPGHVLTLLLALLPVRAEHTQQEPWQFDVEVAAGQVGRPASTLIVRLDDADLLAAARVSPRMTAQLQRDGRTVAAQTEIQRDDGGAPTAVMVHAVLPDLARGARQTFALSLHPGGGGAMPVDAQFRFVDRPGARDLLRGDQPVWRAVTAHDPDDREATYKTFHHLFGRHDEGLLTKGPGGQFSHHRGLFVGWNRTRVGDRSHDFWHCTDGALVRHRRHLEPATTGPVMARSAQEIEWLVAAGGQERVVVRETRELTTWIAPRGRRILDLVVRLSSDAAVVELDGDPHHGGVQLRLASEIASDEQPVTYLRPRDATDQGDDIWQACAWAAAEFERAGHAYTVLHLDHPDNPRPTVYSTRPYGRFGAFCRATIRLDTPVELRYRLWLVDRGAEPEFDAVGCAELSADFATPVGVTVRRRRG